MASLQTHFKHHINLFLTYTCLDCFSPKVENSCMYLITICKLIFTSPMWRLLNSGGPIISKRLPIRLVAGIWCLAAFVLSQAYNSTLITYVIAPNNPPLINSVLDIVNNPNIHLVVEKNMGLDVVISVRTFKICANLL